MNTLKESPFDKYQVLAVKHIVASQAVNEGEGVLVHRSFPTRQIDQLDPFLLLDEMGPTNFKPHLAKGFPDHPHKGFETVTYMLAGAMRHRDSVGNQGFLQPGDVQWMTAGRGIVHSEMPDPRFAAAGGLMHGFQLWVNLPSKDKLVAPRYQDLPAAAVPTARSVDGLTSVKIIAGESLGVAAPIETHTKITYLHFTLQPGATFAQPMPSTYNTMAYIIKGEAVFAGKRAGAGQLVIFERLPAPDENPAVPSAIAFGAEIEATEPLELLLIGGEPLGEPVARYGPFVMNTREEIIEATREYQEGLLGKISH
ncbi:MAG: pirin family protein [Cyanobacteria bacterium REEB67]|nr:pirin family protein [Cyanobacteria bacterium REEB67]